MRYGYMDGASTSGKSANLLSPDALSDSIKDFQRFAGLPVTGDMDGNTEKFMSMPRCGVKDKGGRASYNWFSSSFTVLVHRIANRIWKDTKHQPGTAGSGNMLGCCLIYFHFLWAILSTSTACRLELNYRVAHQVADKLLLTLK